VKTITVGQLRQNPTEALEEVEAGQTYLITRHQHRIARLVPDEAGVVLIPPKKTGGTHLTGIAPHELRTASSIDELLDEERGSW